MLSCMTRNLPGSFSAALVLLVVAGCGSSAPRPATGLRISEIAVYQGVKVTVMRDGRSVEEPSAPLIEGRDGMLRVFVATELGWRPRLILGRLELARGGRPLPVIEARALLEGSSSEATLSSTLQFPFPGEWLSRDTSYSVSLFEMDDEAPSPGSSEGSLFPLANKAPLSAQDTGDGLTVVVVPMRYQADGKGRTPVATEIQLERMRSMLLAAYPVAKVQISVREPADLQVEVSPGGEGWAAALGLLLSIRMADEAAPNVYYYGVFSPAESFREYCRGGCTTGLSLLATHPDDEVVRGGVGVGWTTDLMPGTFIHELGHAHGRLHAPCGSPDPDSIDTHYPYPDGSIGTWGYAMADRRLRSPDDAKDFMGYCHPFWVSDYTYRALFKRITHVNESAGAAKPQATAEERSTWRMLALGPSALTLGERIALAREPLGNAIEASRLDPHGRVVGRARARYYQFGDLPGGIVFMPESELHGAALAVEGRLLRLQPRAQVDLR
jgi:hypothetical protein